MGNETFDLIKAVKDTGIKIPKEDLEKLEFLSQLMTQPTKGMEDTDTVYRPSMMRLYQRSSRDESAPEDIKPGDIYADGQIFHREKDGAGVRVVPIYGWSSHQRWPDGETFPDCWSDDTHFSANRGISCASCPTRPWKNNQPQDCKQVINWFFLLEDLSGFYHVPFRSSSLKAGNNITRSMKNRPAVWDAYFKLATKGQENKMGKYFVWTTTPLSEKPAPHIQAFAEALYDLTKEQRNAMLDRQAAQRMSSADGASAGTDDQMEGDVDDM